MQSTFIGTRKLTEGNYVIWYENERSIKAKLRLIGKHNIKGTGSWALQHEVPSTWDYYSLWLNGNYFRDVASNFWAEEHILNVSSRGWMNGSTSTIFNPNNTLTRAQGAVILVRALGLAGNTPNQYVFNDTKGHWAQKEIEIARENGFLSGVSPDRFNPEAPLTRAQLAKILHNIFPYPIQEANDSPFTDVSQSHWAYEPVVSIYQKGHLRRYDDGTFRPLAISTRAQMAALMDRLSSDFDQFKQNNN